jgi:pimeloyl-ACP methyl ester carboxylesterase
MEQFRRGELIFDVRDGGPEGGEPVVLLHGFPQDGTSWKHVQPLLQQAGVRTLTPDQRGYSPGARPAGRRAYVIDELVADVLALLDQAGLASAHIVGHDWGGLVGWTLAGNHPERVRSLTALSTPHPTAMLRATRWGSQWLKAWHVLFFQLPVLPERVLRRGMAAGLVRVGLPGEDAKHFAARMREPGALTAALNWYRAIPLARRAARSRSMKTMVPKTTVPTTYVWGRHDKYLARSAAEATAGYVTAAYRFVELDAGHWLPETRPTELADLILTQVRSAT